MSTDKRDYNCRHCFNVKDNAQLTADNLLMNSGKLLDQSVEVGARPFAITGGERMGHYRFLDIDWEVFSRGRIIHIQTCG